MNTEKYGKIRHTVLSVTAFIFILFLAHPQSAHSKAAKRSLEYNNGLVTIHNINISRIKFLRELSEVANLQIIVVEDIDSDQMITVNFKNEPVEQVLRHVLKGCSYAVIYNTSEDEQETIISYNANKNIRANHDLSGSDKPLNTKEATRQMLAQTVEELKCRIESGESDRDYESWAKIRDPKFVVHDRDRLKQYQQQLNNL